MTSLTAIFGNSPDKPAEESEKLLNLYWNRAELKKAFAELRNEQYRLQDKVKEQQGVTARVQQKLDHLEHLLLDAEWVHSVVVHYHFKALNLRCENKIAKFAEQLKQKREQRQHRRALDAWNASRSEEAAGIQRRIGEQRLTAQSLEDQIQHERQRLASMSGFVRLFRKRSVTAHLDSLAASSDETEAKERALLDELEEIESRQPPDVEGLGCAAKRSINFMILAFVQQLYLHYREDDIAIMAKEAGDRSVGAIKYGDKKDCDALMARVRHRLEHFEKIASFADVLKQRAKLLAEQAEFRGEDDAVPAAHSVMTVFDIGEDGRISTEQVNLLGEDYWNLSEYLSR